MKRKTNKCKLNHKHKYYRLWKRGKGGVQQQNMTMRNILFLSTQC